MPKPTAGAVLLAAGLGARLKSPTRKAMVRLGSKPIFEWPLWSLLKSPSVGEIALVVHPHDFKSRSAWARRQAFPKPVAVVAGGAQRQDSVANGLAALDVGWKVMLVHDAARPFLNRSLIHECVLTAAKAGGALAVVPVKDTIKMVEGGRMKTLPRERLLAAQTPQASRSGILLRAHAWAQQKKRYFTDETSLLEARGHNSVPVKSYYENFKITTPEDLSLARVLIKSFNFES